MRRLSDRPAWASYLRKAEGEMVELGRQFPGRPAYRRALIDIRIDLCLALYNNADGAGAAVATAREAVAEGEALRAAPHASDDDIDKAAWAHWTLARFIGLLGRFGEAIAEEQKSIAIEEPLAARNPGKTLYVTHLTSMCADAASYYITVSPMIGHPSSRTDPKPCATWMSPRPLPRETRIR